jgi:hypothetical protein
MAASVPEFGAGSFLEVNTGTFATLANVTTVDPPDVAVMEVDRPLLAGVSLKSRAFNPRKDPGEFSFTYELDEDNYSIVEALKGTSKSWRFTISEYGLQMAWTGVLKTNKPNAVEGESIATATCTGRLTSLITVAETTAP